MKRDKKEVVSKVILNGCSNIITCDKCNLP